MLHQFQISISGFLFWQVRPQWELTSLAQAAALVERREFQILRLNADGRERWCARELDSANRVTRVGVCPGELQYAGVGHIQAAVAGESARERDGIAHRVERADGAVKVRQIYVQRGSDQLTAAPTVPPPKLMAYLLLPPAVVMPLDPI